MRHQYGISALVTQTSFCEGSSGDLARRQLFSQASLKFKFWILLFFSCKSSLIQMLYNVERLRYKVSKPFHTTDNSQANIIIIYTSFFKFVIRNPS